MLDIGCGSGETTRRAAQIAIDGGVLGVDLSNQMLARARERSASAGLTNVKLERADATRDRAFGAVRAAIDVHATDRGVQFGSVARLIAAMR